MPTYFNLVPRQEVSRPLIVKKTLPEDGSSYGNTYKYDLALPDSFFTFRSPPRGFTYSEAQVFLTNTLTRGSTYTVTTIDGNTYTGIILDCSVAGIEGNSFYEVTLRMRLNQE